MTELEQEAEKLTELLKEKRSELFGVIADEIAIEFDDGDRTRLFVNQAPAGLDISVT
jgi:hypothetical protein